VRTDPLFYDVYTRISELHLAEIGLDVQWSDVDVRPLQYEERWNKSREYFTLPNYRLPLAYLHTLL
jgi:protein arginine N-methyltransferase 2